MKFTLKVLLTCLIFAAAGLTSFHTGTNIQPAVTPTPVTDVIITENELITLASQAHQDTVNLFTQAFEAELFHNNKPNWQEIRPQLTKYWSEKIIENDLKKFYNDHLREWGYEMGFVFPLWQPQTIESVKIVSSSNQEIIVEFDALTNYNSREKITVTFIPAGENWVINSPLFIQAESLV